MDYVENIANHSTFNSQRNLGVAFLGGGNWDLYVRLRENTLCFDNRLSYSCKLQNYQKTGYVQELNLLIFFAQLHVPHSHEKWVSS